VGLGSRFAAAWRAFARNGAEEPAHGNGDAHAALAAALQRSQSQLQSVAEAVGSRTRIVVDRVDEQRSIIDETYHSIDQLNAGIRKITDNVEALSASSEETSSSMLEMVASIEEVSRHTDTLFRSVDETASATEEMVSSISEVDHSAGFLSKFATDTSSSMTEMSASIAQVESNAARSYELALGVANAAESGMRAVRETIDGMEQIRRSVAESNAVVTRLGERSTAIGKILNVIDDVAEQTNLLALNAAILAAAAGEHGRGFSVVAAQIRELSERTAASTREISGLIRSVQEEVENALRTMGAGTRLVEQGVGLSHDAGKALNNILESASKASDMGKEIAAATREQAQGSANVTHAVERLQELVNQIGTATRQQAQGSSHIGRAVESMREVTKYVRQAMAEQRSGSTMISAAAERMIEMIHEIFSVATSQAAESEKIVATMQQVRAIADGNRTSAGEMIDSLGLLNEAIRSVGESLRG
jgi:methyl-accepting chemotaxis protein